MRLGSVIFAAGIATAMLAGEALYGQTKLDLRTQTRNVDFSAATTTKPSKMGGALPSVCDVGETFFLTGVPAGQNFYLCAAANTWTAVSVPAPAISSLSGIASMAQGGTGAGTASAALTNLGAAAAVHTHVLTDLMGITGKQGAAGLLQAFGGGTVNANDCAKFDASGNVVSSGAPCGTASSSSLFGFSSDGSTPNTSGQFYGWDASASKFSVYSLGSLISLTGKTINVATDSVPQYAYSTSVPSSCSQYGLFYFQTTAAAGNKLFYCNGATYEPVTSGLSDPGSNGILLRTALNTTAAAVRGTDYYAPGTAIASSDLPTPTVGAGGKVQAKSCAAGDFVNAINTDSTVGCATPASQAGSAQTTQSNTYAAGAKQSFQASASTAGAQVVCGALPSTPAAGDLACDSSDSSKLKQWNGSLWMTLGFNGTGMADPGSNGIVARTAAGSTASRTVTAGSSKVSIANGDGVAGNPTVDVTEANLTLSNMGGMLGASHGGTGVAGTITGIDYANGAGPHTQANASQINSPALCAGTANSGSAEVCSTTPAFTPAAGDRIVFKNGTVAVTGTFAINVNGSGAKAVMKQGGSTALIANDILAGQYVELVYDGTNWEMQSQTGNGAAGGSTPRYGQILSGDNTVTGLPITDSVDWDEFFQTSTVQSNIGKLSWNYTQCNAGANLQPAADTAFAGHPGVYLLGTGTSSGTLCSLSLGSPSNGMTMFQDLSAINNWEFVFIIQPKTSVDNNTILRVGLLDTNASAPDLTMGSYMMELSAANGIPGDFYLKSCNLTPMCNAADTGVAPVVGHWYKIRIWSDAAGTIKGAVSTDGGAYSSAVSVAANHTRTTAPMFFVKTLTAANRDMYVDYFGYRISGMNR